MPEMRSGQPYVQSKRHNTALVWIGLIFETLRGFAPVTTAQAATAFQVAQNEQTFAFEIPAQSLSSAIDAFINVTNWQVGYGSDLTHGIVSPGVSGRYTAREALDQLYKLKELYARGK